MSGSGIRHIGTKDGKIDTHERLNFKPSLISKPNLRMSHGTYVKQKKDCS
jgi:hypothetical protein